MTSSELNPTRINGEATALAPSEAETEHAYAWSMDETADLDAPTERYSWGVTWLNVGALIGCAAAVAFVIAVVAWSFLPGHDAQIPRAPAPSVAAPAPMPSATPAPPVSGPDDQIVPSPNVQLEKPTPEAAPPSSQTLSPPRPSSTALDELYLGTLTSGGLTITDVPDAIQGAHEVCAFLAAGHTESEAVQIGMRNNTALTFALATTAIETATAVYCPQYSGR